MADDVTTTLTNMVPTVVAVGVIDRASRIGREKRTTVWRKSKMATQRRTSKPKTYYQGEGKYSVLSTTKEGVVRKARAINRTTLKNNVGGLLITKPKITRVTYTGKNSWKRW